MRTAAVLPRLYLGAYLSHACMLLHMACRAVDGCRAAILASVGSARRSTPVAWYVLLTIVYVCTGPWTGADCLRKLHLESGESDALSRHDGVKHPVTLYVDHCVAVSSIVSYVWADFALACL